MNLHWIDWAVVLIPLGLVLWIAWRTQRYVRGIVEFMTGYRPSSVPPAEWDTRSRVKCLALAYEGEDAVSKIRAVLGPTDPHKAPDGTIRREFGSDVMVNTAHASDSAENAKREMGILRMAESPFVPVLRAALQETGF